jgi:hypothetical protein
MSAKTARPASRHSDLLQIRVDQAEQLVRALRVLHGRAAPGDPGYLWLLGRADEVRTLVDEVVREWTAGSIDAARACEAIRSYVDAIHFKLHRRYGGCGASCCGPHLEPFTRGDVKRAEVHTTRARLESGLQEVVRDDRSKTRREPLAAIPLQRKYAG